MHLDRLLAALLPTLLLRSAAAQVIDRSYQSSAFELAAMDARIDYKGSSDGGVVRFAPVIQAQHSFNYDLGAHAGVFAGASVNNIGFIYQDPNGVDVFKFRTYNLGLPVGVKLGTMERGLLFAGWSVEWPVNYREKTFSYGDRTDRLNAWLSPRVENPQQAVMVGYQSKVGIHLKVKYYITNFHNMDFSEQTAGQFNTPYAGLQANVLYVALGYGLFQRHGIAYGI